MVAEAETHTTSLPLTFSAQAIAALIRIRSEENVADDKMLRVGVKGGGCSGMTYILEYDVKTDHDQVYDVDGLQFVLDKRHAMYLLNMHVDFQDGLNSRGFSFQNPNAKTTCGCGTSFGT